MLQKVFDHLVMMLRDKGGISYGRAASALILLVCLTWDTAYLTFVMLHWRALFAQGVTIRDVLPPSMALAGQTAFIATPYTINKFSPTRDSPQ